MRGNSRRTTTARAILVACGLGGGLVGCQATIEVEPSRSEKIPVTTSSSEARALFLGGRDLADKIRQAEAREVFERAVERDPDFALAHLMLANTARSALEFFDGLERAVELAETVSEGERLLILGRDAASRGDLTTQRRYLTRLVELYPRDERAHLALGSDHFARQEYEQAIAECRQATSIAPEFSPAHNLLGYAYRSAGRFAEAEEAFRRYIELIPDEPNPYDSYAEFLMKRGRFEESITNYEKALEIAPHFVASYVGIGNNQILLGRTAEAHASLVRLSEVARNDGERRRALFWAAVFHLHDGDHAAAEETYREMLAIAEAGGDWAQVAGDLALIGDVRREAGHPGRALAVYDEALTMIDKADVNEDVKDTFGRAMLYRRARVALERGDLAAAEELTDAYADAVADRNVPSEVWRLRELQGLHALAAGDPLAAAGHLEEANQQDPAVLYRLALAYRQSGQTELARETARTAAEWNQLGMTYAFVRERARRLAAEL